MRKDVLGAASRLIAAAAAACLVLAGAVGCAKNETPGAQPGATEQAGSAQPETGAPSGTPSPSPDFSAEKAVYELFKGAETKQEDVPKIIAALPGVNWSEYAAYAENGSGDAVALIEWLQGLDIFEEADMARLIGATDGLDGAMSESYSSLLAKLFASHAEQFTRALSKVDGDRQDAACSLVAYGCGYAEMREDAKKAVEQVKKLIDIGAFGEAELTAAEKLVNAVGVEKK